MLSKLAAHVSALRGSAAPLYRQAGLRRTRGIMNAREPTSLAPLGHGVAVLAQGLTSEAIQGGGHARKTG